MSLLTSTKSSAKSVSMTDQVTQAEIDDDDDDSDYVLTKMIVSVSDFKKNPNKYVARLGKQADNLAFAVMTNNKPSFYVLTPEFFDYLLEQKWESDNRDMILERLAEAKAGDKIPVNIEDLLNGDIFADISEEGSN